MSIPCLQILISLKVKEKQLSFKVTLWDQPAAHKSGSLEKELVRNSTVKYNNLSLVKFLKNISPSERQLLALLLNYHIRRCI